MTIIAQSAPGMQYVPPMLLLLAVGSVSGLTAALLRPTTLLSGRSILAVVAVGLGIALPISAVFAFEGPSPVVFPVLAIPAILGVIALLRRKPAEVQGFEVITKDRGGPGAV